MKIHIKDLRFEAILGILEHERIHPQPVCLHVKISYHFDGHAFIDYAKVCELIIQNMQEQKYGLVEVALEGICHKIAGEYPNISKISLKIFKPTILENATVGVSRTFHLTKN
jgi:dihydroneopterin aldolase